MKLLELYRNPTELIDDRQHIIEVIEDWLANKNFDKIEAAAEIFSNFGYRDDKEGWKRGIPFSTNSTDLNRIIATISAQGDEMASKRLKRKILELTNDG